MYVTIFGIFSIFALGVFASPAAPPVTSTEFTVAFEACKKEFSIDDEAIKTNIIPDDKKCFHKCMAIKTGVMTESGDLLVSDFKAKLQKIHAPQVWIDNVEECGAKITKMADPCDTAKAMCDCVYKKLSP